MCVCVCVPFGRSCVQGVFPRLVSALALAIDPGIIFKKEMGGWMGGNIKKWTVIYKSG